MKVYVVTVSGFSNPDYENGIIGVYKTLADAKNAIREAWNLCYSTYFEPTQPLVFWEHDDGANDDHNYYYITEVEVKEEHR